MKHSGTDASYSEQDLMNKMVLNSETSEKMVIFVQEAQRRLPHDVNLYLLLIPIYRYTINDLGEFYRKFLTKFCDQIDKRIYLIDLHPFMKSLHYYKKDKHWNRNGHIVVAKHIEENIFLQ